jgi:hypothetical protein
MENVVITPAAARERSVLHYAEMAKSQQAAGQPDAAMRCFVIATLLQSAVITPADPALYFQLGLAFDRQGQGSDAAHAFRSALLLQPTFAEAYSNFGTYQKGEAAIAPQRRAVQLAPERAAFHTNLAHSLLSAGQFREGFQEWEWREPSPKRDFIAPLWQGERFVGKTLLIHAEQGYGDSLQFCRYIEAAAGFGGTIIVESRAPMAGLLGRIPGVASVIPWGSPLPDIDFHIPMPSLAKFFAPDFGRQPYLTQSLPHQEKWQRIFANFANLDIPRIGLVWSGNPRGPDPRRAVLFSAVAAFARRYPRFRFFGLQREMPEIQEEDGGIIQLGRLIDDFDDLAAALDSVDVLISVDTAAAHLAGALNRPVWVLLHHDADWRWWGPEADRTHWYQKARLFRQTAANDWTGVLEQVGNCLVEAGKS